MMARHLAQLLASEDAYAVHALGGLGTHAPELLDPQRGDEVEGTRGMDDAESVGLAEVAGYLGEKLVVGHACRGSEMELVGNALLDFAGYLDRYIHVALVVGDIEKCLVERYGLDEVGIVGKDGMYLCRHLGIVVVPAWHHDELGTKAVGDNHRLGRVNTIAACLVAGSTHHAALAVEAHGNGLATE